MVLAAEPLEPRDVPTLFGAAGGVPLGGGFAPDPAQTFRFQSLPDTPWTVWLDFRGGDIDLSRSVWRNIRTSVSTPAFDQDGDPSSFSVGELASIQHIARSVAEDYAPFNVNVTTQRPADLTHTQRIVIGGDGAEMDPQRRYSGLSFGHIRDNGTFWWGTLEGISFVWSERLGNRTDYVAEVVSHEAGHAFGLSHKGTATSEYYRGANGWAPVMGAAFGAGLSQWDNGTYPGATSHEPDADVIAATAGWRPDDFGDSFATAAALLSGRQQTGLIGTRSDVDAFRFASGAGPVSVSFAGAVGGNLYARVSLYDAAGKLLAQGDGTTATLTARAPGGTYYVTVDGIAGPAPNDYGSLGQFWVAATAAPEEIPLPPAGAAGLAVAGVARTEADYGLTGFIFRITLPAPLPYPLTLSYATADGTARAGEDYVAASGTVTFKAAIRTVTVTVQVRADREPEPDEWFALTVGDVTATGLVLNDDGPALLFVAPDGGSKQGLRGG